MKNEIKVITEKTRVSFKDLGISDQPTVNQKAMTEKKERIRQLLKEEGYDSQQ